MKIAEITAKLTIQEIISDLKLRSTPAPNLADIKKQIDITQHDIMDKTLYPDRPVRNDAGVIQRYEPLNRIPLDFQNLIIRKAVSFSMGKPVTRSYSGNEDTKGKVVETFVERVLRDNMSLTLDRKVARLIYTFKEVAEYWYPVDVATNSAFESYGFQSAFKLNCAVFSAENGNLLYPLFDKYERLIALSREYVLQENSQNTSVTLPMNVTYFQTFTSDEIVTWKQDPIVLGGWSEVERVPLTTGKMPIVYGYQPESEYECVKFIINRLEILLSKNAEINDYHAGPKLLVNGTITGFGQKGQNNMIIQGEKGADAKYLSWDSAPESVKNEINNLLSLIYTLTQTPNISFDNVKSGLGALSGLAIKLLFMDAHLKVVDKETIFLEYFQRRYSVVCSYLRKLQVNDTALHKAADNIEINPELHPYMIADDKEMAEVLLMLNGQQPVVSQETSVAQNGGDDQEYKRLQKEAKARNTMSIGDPTA